MQNVTTQPVSPALSPRADRLNAFEYVMLGLAIIGALNWGLVGLFRFNLVAWLFGDMTVASRIVYVIVGIAGAYCIWLATQIRTSTPTRT